MGTVEDSKDSTCKRALIAGLHTLYGGRGKGQCSVACGGDNGGGVSQKTTKNWAILFARTGLEGKLVDALKEKLNAEEYLPFVPTKETPYRNKGVLHKIRKPLFPGYVFVQTEIEPSRIADRLETELKGVKEVYTILHYGNDRKDVVVREEERLYWDRLFDENFCVVGSVGFIVGDTIHITSGALVGLEGQIKKIDRHKRIAIVEMKMMGAARDVSLMLEVVEKS